ncbi:hypothetical protein BDV28DRAFT_162258 [Aspergillus coremiiformis]|uniref:Uncharacterized protein n=1 Tax=Aspergillus coremiiformis TaxID=138285 RepID=A0A5N6Z3I4_9EURO|nr:hypothetical protein BDV28DRAFT_162258 [Aspergillus coremiiformis]
MADRNERGEDNDPFRQLRYLPPPQTNQYRHASQLLFHPQPIRPGLGPAYLRQGTDTIGAISSFSVREGLFGQSELSPGARYFATNEIHFFQRQAIGFPTERPCWHFGDPIPPGWRVTVTPHVVNSPRPEQHRILVPERESYERRREIPLSLLLCPDRTVIEHATILHSMKNSENETVPTDDPNTMSRPRSTHEDTPMASADPIVHNPSQETAVPETTDQLDDTTSIPTLEKEVIPCEFEELATHTAKCDICNKRNTSGMSRCLTCGWQTCNPCTIARGCFRTHHVNGNIHTGPTNQRDLDAAAQEISKAKKKTTPSKKKKKTGNRSRNASKPKKGRPPKKKTAKKVPRTPSKSPILSRKEDADQEASAEEPNRKTQNDQGAWDVDSVFDDDATEDLPDDDLLEKEEVAPWSPLNTPGNLPSQTLQQVRESLRQKKSSGQKDGLTDAEKSVPESKSPEQKPGSTKAQVYCRKQPGRYSPM